MCRICGTCGNNSNRLDILDVSDITNPELIASYPMDNPHGLGVEGDVLFICNGHLGLKVLNVADPLAVSVLGLYSELVCTDLIAVQGGLLLTAPDTIEQFDYQDGVLLVKSTIEPGTELLRQNQQENKRKDDGYFFLCDPLFSRDCKR